MNKNAMKRIIIMMNVILVFLAACGKDTTDDNVVEQIEFTPNQSAYIMQIPLERYAHSEICGTSILI